MRRPANGVHTVVIECVSELERVHEIEDLIVVDRSAGAGGGDLHDPWQGSLSVCALCAVCGGKAGDCALVSISTWVPLTSARPAAQRKQETRDRLVVSVMIE